MAIKSVASDYELCVICDHTPAFCHCSPTGLSRAELRKCRQEIIIESICDDKELLWVMALQAVAIKIIQDE